MNRIALGALESLDRHDVLQPSLSKTLPSDSIVVSEFTSTFGTEFVTVENRNVCLPEKNEDSMLESRKYKSLQDTIPLFAQFLHCLASDWCQCFNFNSVLFTKSHVFTMIHGD
jgi:hypothetical protein